MPLLGAGCDSGHQSNAAHGTGAPIQLLATNVSTSQSIATGAPIELAFDRLLLPTSVTRQTFVVQDLLGNYLEPQPSYDPVSRVVRLCVVLPPDQTYRLTIVAPQNAQDPAGLRAIDGAGLGADQPSVFEFPVTSGPAYVGADACPGTPTGVGASAPVDAGLDGPLDGGSTDAGSTDAGSTDAAADSASPVDAGAVSDAQAETGAAATPPAAVDFCSQVLPIFVSSCGGNNCHGAAPAAGLELTSSSGIAATAVGRVAQGSNTGTRSTVTAPPAGRLFGVDMAIIAPNDPGDSWLLYKLLMADPPPCAASAASCDASTVSAPGNDYDVAWTPLADTERSTLSGFIPGREMPYPTDPNAPLAAATAPLTLEEMELLAQWIRQGAGVETCSQ